MDVRKLDFCGHWDVLADCTVVSVLSNVDNVFSFFESTVVVIGMSKGSIIVI